MPGYGDERPVQTNMSEWVDRVLAVDGELDLVAHSYGGLAAILAAAQAPERVRSLTLFEPAAYSYARGRPDVEAMIERMTPVIDEAPALHAVDYDIKFVTALTGSRPSRVESPGDVLAAERNRLLAPPWSFDLPIDVLSTVPTLVLTGDWNAEYEEIGQAMGDAGSRHAQLVGYGHRPQDHPDANSVIVDGISGAR
jgi:pimeloyl-ACP methyl ester carboxylesterase